VLHQQPHQPLQLAPALEHAPRLQHAKQQVDLGNDQLRVGLQELGAAEPQYWQAVGALEALDPL
jgi:hypothetical protein